MKKKTKIILGVLVFIMIMVIAVVGAYFIAKSNLSKEGWTAGYEAAVEAGNYDT